MKPKLALIALALDLCLTWLILLLVEANRASAGIPAGESSAHTTASPATLDPTSPTCIDRIAFENCQSTPAVYQAAEIVQG